MSKAKPYGQRTANEFYKGDRVLYVPRHLRPFFRKYECKRGVVSSVNSAWVFVKYDNAVMKTETGDEDYTAQATDPNDLIKLSELV